MIDTAVADLRRQFLTFFEQNDHAIVKSSPLVPQNDPSLMFVNAGMVQFKDLFIGAETRAYKRATSSQKCMRVSGKHNDLEEVGRTARHHTFFEMLGNFSFGDYFKEEAIALAWEFSVKTMGLSPDRIWITVFGGADGVPPDDEAKALWRKISGLPEHRILEMGMKDNFWSMGDTGPCGPCTEMHFDLGPSLGGTTNPTLQDFESGRVVEFWNNVFMQFERRADGSLVPLPAPSVDTGMGLERLAALVQGETSNYHTDLFRPLLDTISDAVGKKYERSDSEDDVSMRVIADHARATAFLVADGIQPSNDGRGYVLRRIMRRAIRHGKRLGFDDLFFHRACRVVVSTMGEAFPELRDASLLIEKVAQTEEQGFRRTLNNGLTILAREIQKVEQEAPQDTTQQAAPTQPDEETEAKQAGSANGRRLSGEVVFRLYDTYGFPKDLTEVIANEHGLGIDEEGFSKAMAAQQAQSQGSDVGGAAVAEIYKVLHQRMGPTEFIGYASEDDPIESRGDGWRLHGVDDTVYLQTRTRVGAVLVQGAEVDWADEGEAEVVLSPTPFYGESGGQVGDRGVIVSGDDDLAVEVRDVQRPVEGLSVCRVRVLRGQLRKGAEVWAGYVPAVRKAIRAHHSATHLLHAALRGVLGDHVKQAGSLVDPERLRFDYSHFEPLTDGQKAAVEDDANGRVAENADVCTDILPFDVAKERGAIALFGEKYGDVVRVVTMGSSVEFCGGTHARRTGDIGMVLITRDEAVAAGVRRLEAQVGAAAERTVEQTAANLGRAAQLMDGRLGGDCIADDQPILLAVAKAVRRYDELVRTLREAGGEPVLVDTDAIGTLELGDPITLQQARDTRDLWQAMTHMANARGAAAESILHAHAEIDTGQLLATFAGLQQANRQNERLLADSRRRGLTDQIDVLLADAKDVAGVRVLTTRVEGVDGKSLRDLADALRLKLKSGILCLGAPQEGGKISLLIAVTKDLTDRFKAGNLIREIAPEVGGRGGGKPELAQAGGNQPERLDEAFSKLLALLQAG